MVFVRENAINAVNTGETWLTVKKDEVKMDEEWNRRDGKVKGNREKVKEEEKESKNDAGVRIAAQHRRTTASQMKIALGPYTPARPPRSLVDLIS